MLLKKITVLMLSLAVVASSGTIALANAVGGDTTIHSQAYIRTSHGDVMMGGNADASTSVGTRIRNFFLHGSSTESSTVNIEMRKAAADRIINNRIDALNRLKTRIDSMKKLSASDKTSLDAEIVASIGDLTTLKAKIDADTDISVLKTDISSITASLRIYALVMPKIAVLSASDRIHTLVDMMTTIGNKFETRTNQLKADGKVTTSLDALLSDYRAKIADANVQADAAISAVINLKPDNGDRTIAAANKTAMEKARDLIKTAREDLKTARKDAQQLLEGIRVFGDFSIHASSTASTTESH
jgi:hypothetical protein